MLHVKITWASFQGPHGPWEDVLTQAGPGHRYFTGASVSD